MDRGAPRRRYSTPRLVSSVLLGEEYLIHFHQIMVCCRWRTGERYVRHSEYTVVSYYVEQRGFQAQVGGQIPTAEASKSCNISLAGT
jgi:hypothetical protein